MPRLSWLADAARATGYPVTEVQGWESRGTTTFNPRGLVWHHTAGAATGDMPSLNILVNGRSGLPGPLSQYGLGRSGRIYVVAAGRANHAGSGGWNGLTGNGSVVGIEAEHVGKTPPGWPTVQMDAYRKLSAEILRRLNTTVDFMCGHKEWAPTRKIDPISLNMNDERARVAALMATPGEDDDVQSLRLFVAEAISKGWLSWPDEGTYWLNLCETPNDPQWRNNFEPAWNTWKQAEAKAIGAGGPAGPQGPKGDPGPKGDKGDPGTGGVNESRVRELAVEAGQEVFVEKGKPVVIRGS